jgi:hypothetical protein
MRTNNLIGRTFERFTVLEYVGVVAYKRVYRCRCVCGVVKTVRGADLVSRKIKSCGCLSREVTRKNFTRHGESKSTKEYRTWCHILGRCLNPKNSRYNYYGARGIQVCTRWQASYLNFLEDVGRCPSGCTSLDRINNDGNYEPGSVRWAVQKQQNRNSRHTHNVTVGNQTLCISEWAERTGISADNIRARLRLGWPPELAVSTSTSRSNRFNTIGVLGCSR